MHYPEPLEIYVYFEDKISDTQIVLFFPQVKNNYLPMQNFENISPKRSSEDIGLNT